MYSIYKHTTPDGKVYIGQTSRKPEYRWNSGKGYTRKKHKEFYEAILTYGWDNISHEILETVKTSQEAKNRESYYIFLYNSGNPNYGYNIHKKSVRCVETGVIYNNVPEASELLGLSQSHIHECAKGKRKTCGGYRWEYVSDKPVL